MPRDGNTAVFTAAAQPAVRMAFLVQVAFDSGTVSVWTGIGPLTWNGITWLGVGSLLSIPGFEETNTVEAKGTTIEMSGLDPALLAASLGEIKHGQAVSIYLAFFQESSPMNMEPIADPILIWAGKLDQPTIEVSGETATITLACENRLMQMNVAADRRYTHEDQQRDHPGDMGFSFVDQCQEVTLYWGRTPCSTGNV